jgi:hypothetical protein
MGPNIIRHIKLVARTAVQKSTKYLVVKKIEYCEYVVVGSLVSIPRNATLVLGTEFIANQGLYSKQDCEINAAKRLIPVISSQLEGQKILFLCDDLYAKDPMVKLIESMGNANFIITCKDESHKTLIQYLNGIEPQRLNTSTKLPGSMREEVSYRWYEGIPIRDSDDAKLVNYVTASFVTYKKGKARETQHFAFITDLDITEENVAEIVKCGRARWKIENKTFNIIKNHGYNFEHNYGHGKETLAKVIITIILLTYNLDVLCELLDSLWQKAKLKLNTNKAFFEYIRAAIQQRAVRSISTILKRLLKGFNAVPQRYRVREPAFGSD